MTDEASTTDEVLVVCELDAPPAEVWQAWSDPAARMVTMQAEYGGFLMHNRWT